MKKFRMYVDEVGNPGMNAARKPNNRYLSLTGVIIDLDHVKGVVHPRLEALKEDFFGSHPDDPVILHRKELVNGKYPFSALRDPRVRSRFDAELFALLKDLEYIVVTAVIDKVEHQDRYRRWRFHPYHYCLTILVERFALWLDSRGWQGDVLAESRGGREDHKLKESFHRLASGGSTYVNEECMTGCLTSCRLKVKPKSANISGLQLADLLAHPSYKLVVARHDKKALPKGFSGEVIALLESEKYNRSPAGRIEGWGWKWLP